MKRRMALGSQRLEKSVRPTPHLLPRSRRGRAPMLRGRSRGRNVGGVLRALCAWKRRRKRRRRRRLSTRRGMGMVLLPGAAPPGLGPQEVAGQSLMTGRCYAPPASFPCPGLSWTAPQLGTLYQQPGVGYWRSAVRRPELVGCQGGPARVVPSEHDASGGPGAVCAWAAGT